MIAHLIKALFYRGVSIRILHACKKSEVRPLKNKGFVDGVIIALITHSIKALFYRGVSIRILHACKKSEVRPLKNKGFVDGVIIAQKRKAGKRKNPPHPL